MSTLKNVAGFDKTLLNTLKQDANAGVELQQAKHHLSLHPIHLHDVNKSIKNILNAGIGKYDKKLSGIVLGYQNVKMLNDKGVIVNDSCYIHINLLVEFFVFKPEIGKEMQGIVNKKSKSHIGVLVYNTFNVSIHKPKADDDWPGSSIKLGEKVLFKILNMNILSQLPYIEGELVSINEIEENDDCQQSASKKRKSKKVHSETDEEIEEGPKRKFKKHKLDNGETQLSFKKKKTVKNGHEESDEIQEDIKAEIDFNDELVTENKNKQKKKSKRTKEDAVEMPKEEPEEMDDDDDQLVSLVLSRRSEISGDEPEQVPSADSSAESSAELETNTDNNIILETKKGVKLGRGNLSLIDLNSSQLFDGINQNSENGMDHLGSKKNKKTKR